MKYPKTVIKFEGDAKTYTGQLIWKVLMSSGVTVHWTNSHELTVIHKEGKIKKREGETGGESR